MPAQIGEFEVSGFKHNPKTCECGAPILAISQRCRKCQSRINALKRWHKETQGTFLAKSPSIMPHKSCSECEHLEELSPKSPKLVSCSELKWEFSREESKTKVLCEEE